MNPETIAIIGTGYVGLATADTRDSPALDIVARLTRRGARVTIYDPVAAPETVPAPTAEDPYSACLVADILVVLTERAEFGSVDLGVHRLGKPPAHPS